MANFADQNAVQDFFDQNGVTLFVDQNGIFLGNETTYGLVLASGSYVVTGIAAAFSRTVSSAFKVHLRRRKV